MYQKELFANYELDSSNWNKGVFKLLGGSLIFHVIILLFLVYVPAVRDAFYVALLFSDAPTGWVNKEYNKTGVEEGDTTSVINLPPSDQLQYPEGYFNLANGNAPAPDLIASTTPYVPEVAGADNTAVAGFPGFTFDQPVATPTPFPTPSAYNPIPAVPNSKKSSGGLPPPLKVKKGAKPPPFLASDGDGEIAGISQPSPTPQTEPKKDAAAKGSPPPAPSPINAQDDKSLNQKPWKDVGAKAIQLMNEKKLDLSQPIDVTIAGELGKDGKFIGKPKIDPSAKADPVMKDMISDFVTALNDSGMLAYIKDLNDGSSQRKVLFNIQKDEKQISVKLVSDIGSADKAGKIASNLNLAFELLKQFKKGSEEGDLLDKVQLSSDKGQVLINWTMPTVDALKKIKEKLDKVAADQKAQQSSQSANQNSQAAIK